MNLSSNWVLLTQNLKLREAQRVSVIEHWCSRSDGRSIWELDQLLDLFCFFKTKAHVVLMLQLASLQLGLLLSELWKCTDVSCVSELKPRVQRFCPCPPSFLVHQTGALTVVLWGQRHPSQPRHWVPAASLCFPADPGALNGISPCSTP